MLLLIFGFRQANEFDEKKMNRDLEIARNILATLIKDSSESFFGGNAIEANYIAGYGVVFTIPEHLVYFHGGPNMVFSIPEPPQIEDFDFHFEFEDESEISERDREEMERQVQEATQQVEQHRDEIRQIRIQREQINMQVEEARRQAEALREQHRQNSSGQNETEDIVGGRRELTIGTSVESKSENVNWEEIMLTFMTDYADLIGQLQAEEKIVIKQKSPGKMLMPGHGSGVDDKKMSSSASISAEVLRKDVEAFRIGKINKEEYIRRITIAREEAKGKSADMEMFISIFDRYYSRDLSETYFIINQANYDMLEGYGAVVNVKVISPISKNRVYFQRPGKELTIEQKQGIEKDEALYQQFKAGISDFLLDYGRTLRSLASGDKLRLDIEIVPFSESNVPQGLEVTADLATLQQYDQRKITPEKARSSIEIKEKFRVTH
ncbi:MAG: hypothetical protein HC819_09580 [Cyclobacteriaceae bacterium]|nr:hypothetical protein [Cyclobacteriaceae bacterium]